MNTTIFTFENIYKAYKKCLKNKKNTANALKFELNREKNLNRLLYDLQTGRYNISRHICFIVTHPSPREIFAADFRDRIVHHLLCNEIQDIFEKNFSDNSYAIGATLTIKAKNTSQYDSIASFLKNYQSVNLSENHIDKINYFDNKQAIDTLNNVIDGSQKFGFIISVIFIIIAIVITLNTLRLAIYISKNEIHVMNLVGATEGYIRGPFIVTGAIYGIMATFIVMLLLVPISLWMTSIVQNFFIDVNFMDYYIQDFWRLVMWLLISGIVTGAVASSLAVRKYVNSKRR